jgi:hypothetical protein
VAVNYYGNAARFNGTTWSTDNVDGTTSLRDVSCTTTFCVTIDSTGAVLTYDGATWSSPNSLPGATPDQGSPVSCFGPSGRVVTDDQHVWYGQ